jgi:hypothetical protein
MPAASATHVLAFNVKPMINIFGVTPLLKAIKLDHVRPPMAA